jgi:hypothetical protein
LTTRRARPRTPRSAGREEPGCRQGRLRRHARRPRHPRQRQEHPADPRRPEEDHEGGEGARRRPGARDKTPAKLPANVIDANAQVALLRCCSTRSTPHRPPCRATPGPSPNYPPYPPVASNNPAARHPSPTTTAGQRADSATKITQVRAKGTRRHFRDARQNPAQRHPPRQAEQLRSDGGPGFHAALSASVGGSRAAPTAGQTPASSPTRPARDR